MFLIYNGNILLAGKGGQVRGTVLLKVIDFLTFESKTRSEILSFVNLYNRTGNFNNYIKPFIDGEVFELTVPEKPKSRFQKYRLTEKGKKLLKQ